MKKVLIVEDDKNIASLERDYLEANGFETDIELTGESGLKKALENDYDLIILDIMLPGIDGFEICRILRRDKDTPILFVSAKKDDIDKIRGLGLGADDYIVKPFSPSELVARVKAHINRYERLSNKQQDKSEVIEVGDLRIDVKARRVFKNEKVVFSKDAFFDKIWGFDSMGETSTVTVHINRLRDKIETDTQKPKYIETVWGAGYRFNLQ